ncbi:hypothetical protein PG996_001274 [Apiospora saccharicola]|uniref:Uncharacterized protein n=1 Tax=Apiospora saccharicola TaxID=335842 RepID=A0ABR1WGA2_9PEZI
MLDGLLRGSTLPPRLEDLRRLPLARPRVDMVAVPWTPEEVADSPHIAEAILIMTRVVLEFSHRACKKCAIDANYGTGSYPFRGCLDPPDGSACANCIAKDDGSCRPVRAPSSEVSDWDRCDHGCPSVQDTVSDEIWDKCGRVVTGRSKETYGHSYCDVDSICLDALVPNQGHILRHSPLAVDDLLQSRRVRSVVRMEEALAREIGRLSSEGGPSARELRAGFRKEARFLPLLIHSRSQEEADSKVCKPCFQAREDDGRYQGPYPFLECVRMSPAEPCTNCLWLGMDCC